VSLAAFKTLQQAPATAAGARRCVKSLHTVSKLLLLCICCCLYAAYAAADTVQVHIEGITDPLLKNVLAYLSLEQQHPRLTAERIQRLHQRAPEEIGRALQPFGYYRPQLSAELKPPEQGSTAWQAYYRIEKGPPLPVKTVDVRLEGEGQKDPALQSLLADFPLKAGDTLNHAYYEQGKQALQDLAKDRGYLEASFTKSQLLIDEQAYTAEVTLHFKTGPRYRFGPVTFKQDTFDENFLRRFLTFKSGDFYTLKALSDFRYALTKSRYFEDVTVATVLSLIFHYIKFFNY
jgi:translocation and assembly module TamA